MRARKDILKDDMFLFRNDLAEYRFSDEGMLVYEAIRENDIECLENVIEQYFVARFNHVNKTGVGGFHWTNPDDIIAGKNIDEDNTRKYNKIV